MAKIGLVEGFTMLPEGTTVFKVVKVDYDEDFGKIEVTLQTKAGQKQKETFSILDAEGETNEGALKAFSYFAKTCLNNYTLNEIDHEDLVGCYIEATVVHETYTATKGKNKGKEMKSARLNDYAPAYGFGASDDVEEPDDVEDDLEDDLDDDLDDLD